MRRKLFVGLALLLALLPVLAACGGTTATTTTPTEPADAAPVAEQTEAAPAAEVTQAPPAAEVTEAAPDMTAVSPEATEATDSVVTEEPDTAAATAEPAATDAAGGAATQTAGGAEQPFTIGISNPFISSEYRTQMIQELIEVNQEYMDQGITTELVIESADTDVAGQIQQLQNLISRDVDAILVNPGDVQGLNATLQEAIDQGIIVISVDQELDTPNVYNVGIDQKEWAKTSAQWLADKLGGQGNIVVLEGIPGHPANVARMSGFEEVMANYPDITVLGRDTGNWDEATGQQVMSNFLASFPDLDGYWTQDGMAIGAMQAVLAAAPAEFPVAVSEGRCQSLALWDQRLQEDAEFESIAVANPPGVSPTGLRIAVNMLMGKQVDETKLGGANGLSFVIPVPVVVTKDNFREVYDTTCQDKPPTYLLDGIMTDEEVQQFFQQ